MSNDYVQLNRKFTESQRSNDAQDESAYPLFDQSKGELTWDDLIKEYRVILLAGAGSGKTTEVFEKAQKLRASDENAFFIRFGDIADNFEAGFHVGTYQDFCDWKKSDSEAWLFLDSVDEAKLNDINAFDKALRILNSHINNELQRLHIIITCRLIAWRSKHDLGLFSQKLPYTMDEMTQNNNTRVPHNW